MRTGLITKKVGMSSMFSDNGERYTITFLKVNNCQVIEQKTIEKHGYNALLLGAIDAKTSKVSKPLQQMFAKLQINPKEKLREFRVSGDSFLQIGTTIDVDHFSVGQFIDATGNSIGKGFAGGMKRHNFRGLEASHGVSVSHRSHGSTGGRQDPGRVFKNKKMAGHMGDSRVTIQNLKIIALDKETGIIMVNGSVPGSKGSYVYISDATKKTIQVS
ncbi:MAG: 50S ribosomal protein L3 [Rickettsiaceae bacterium]|nr:MAG: 50S ribosomal protein L3 [Rickettsiaceae bacterium]